MTADQRLHLDHSTPLWEDPTPRAGDRIVHAGCNTGWNRGMKFSTAQRGSTSERGYGSAHVKLRREWAKKVEAGQVQCSRCWGFIVPGSPWDLAHDPDDRTLYAGPQHAACNRGYSTIKRRENGTGNGLQTAGHSRPW
jgi:hypothetical protein